MRACRLFSSAYLAAVVGFGLVFVCTPLGVVFRLCFFVFCLLYVSVCVCVCCDVAFNA